MCCVTKWLFQLRDRDSSESLQKAKHERGEYLVNIGLRIVLGDVLAKHGLELRGRAHGFWP